LISDDDVDKNALIASDAKEPGGLACTEGWRIPWIVSFRSSHFQLYADEP
jgi:hypothetical protein